MGRIATKVEGTTPKRIRYDRDIYGWAMEQAALLNDGRVDELDLSRLSTVIREAALSEYDKLESALRVLLVRMLKWDFQPERRSRSWANTIAVQRRHFAKVLRKNPSLKPHRAEALAEAYADARLDASTETDLNIGAFPKTCPYDWNVILDRPFVWPPDQANT